jgi:hypothetical protein
VGAKVCPQMALKIKAGLLNGKGFCIWTRKQKALVKAFLD